MAERGVDTPAKDQRLAQRAALMTRARKRDVDKAELRGIWEAQAAGLGFDAKALAAEAISKGAVSRDAGREGAGAARETSRDRGLAGEAVEWAVAHLSEREAVFARADLIAGALAWDPGAVAMPEAEHEVGRLEKAGTLHAASLPVAKDMLTTSKAMADERETIALVEAGQGREAVPMRARAVDKALRKGPLTQGQRDAVRLILSDKDRVVGVQGYAGTGKTTMLNRARALLEKRGYEVKGLAPSGPRLPARCRPRPGSRARPCNASLPATPVSPRDV